MMNGLCRYREECKYYHPRYINEIEKQDSSKNNGEIDQGKKSHNNPAYVSARGNNYKHGKWTDFQKIMYEMWELVNNREFQNGNNRYQERYRNQVGWKTSRNNYNNFLGERY